MQAPVLICLTIKNQKPKLHHKNWRSPAHPDSCLLPSHPTTHPPCLTQAEIQRNGMAFRSFHFHSHLRQVNFSAFGPKFIDKCFLSTSKCCCVLIVLLPLRPALYVALGLGCEQPTHSLNILQVSKELNLNNIFPLAPLNHPIIRWISLCTRWFLSICTHRIDFS